MYTQTSKLDPVDSRHGYTARHNAPHYHHITVLDQSYYCIVSLWLQKRKKKKKKECVCVCVSEVLFPTVWPLSSAHTIPSIHAPV